MGSLETFSLIKAMYDLGKDYIDSFWPMLLQVMPRDKRFLAAVPMADAIAKAYGLAVPVHTVQTLAERAKRAHGYLTRRDSAYALTDHGLEFLDRLETTRQVERRIAALIDHAAGALAVVDERFRDRTFTGSAITRVIESHYQVMDFLVERGPGASPPNAPSVEQAVLDYFARLEAAEPLHFDTLRDLILGSTLAGLLKRDDIADATRQFRATEIFLDTNVLLSLLGLRFEVECRPAAELLTLLTRSARFTLHAFDFTIIELTALLRGYAAVGDAYVPNIKVNDLYSSLKYRGITSGDITLLIAHLTARLHSLGITLVTTGVDLDSAPEGAANALATLRTYKPAQDIRGARHDLAAISHIALSRGSRVRKVEDAKCFFLTEDYSLSNYAFKERGHHAEHTVSEVIPDRLLTNLLWLKEPASLQSVPIATVIAMHSRGLFIERRVWSRFHEELKRLTSSKEIAEESADILLYDSQVHKDLVGLGPDPRLVNKEWLLDRLEDAKLRQEDAHAQGLAEQASALADKHDSEVLELRRSGEADLRAGQLQREELLRTLAEERELRTSQAQRLRADSKRRALAIARRATFGIRFICVFALAVAAWRGGLWLGRKWDTVEAPFSIATVIVPTLLLVGGLRLDPRAWWQRLELRLGGHLLARRLKTLDNVLEVRLATTT